MGNSVFYFFVGALIELPFTYFFLVILYNHLNAHVSDNLVVGLWTCVRSIVLSSLT